MSEVRFVAIVGAVTVLLAAVGAWISPRPESGGGDGSSYSASARGGKGAFETLRALGYDIERSIEPMTAVRADPSRTLLVITGAMPASDQDRRALKQFVTAGGAVLLTGFHGAEFLGVVPGSMSSDPFARIAAHPVAAASPLTRGVSEISMIVPSGLPSFPSSYLTLVAASPGEPLVTTARLGEGRVTWLAAVTPIANQHIRASDNFQLLLNIVGQPRDRRILWDEHYHGYSRSFWSYAAATPLPWLIVQCGVIALAACATFSRRRLPIRSTVRDTRTSPMEFVEMLRILYARGGDAASAVGLARNRFRKRATARLGLPAAVRDEDLAARVVGRCSATQEEVAQLLSASRSGVPIDAKHALPIAARLQTLSRELDAPRWAQPTPGSRR